MGRRGSSSGTPPPPEWKGSSCLAVGWPTGLQGPIAVRTLIPSVQGPTKDSGQRRQPPLVVAPPH